jgi:polysaccharide biosynthesis/export protein
MKPAVLFVCLIAMSLGGCSWLPTTGPSAGEVVDQGQAGGEILFDVVEVDGRVVSTLLAQPKEGFQARFAKNAEPPDVKIAVGDTISVLIWESAAGGLFSDAPSTLPSTGSRQQTTEPLTPEAPPRVGPRPGDTGPSSPSIEGIAATSGRQATTIPDQPIGPDGAISIPYAGRIPVAGRFPAEVQQMIEARLADKALEPQALVIVKKSAANAVTVTGEAGPAEAAAGTGLATTATAAGAAAPVSPGGDSGVAAAAVSGLGAKIQLSPGGDRLLQVIAAAGGAKTPVHETFVRLSRGGVTATIPMAKLVSDPEEDIYAQPGDVLTLVRVPQTFSVFGATGRNAQITFDAQNLTLSEALAKSQGLRDDLANPNGVYVFRYEDNSTIRALDQPVASSSRDGSSPVAYRFNFKDGATYLLAKQFPVRDKDIIFVADAGAVQVQKLFTLLSTVTGPIITGLLVCRQSTC